MSRRQKIACPKTVTFGLSLEILPTLPMNPRSLTCLALCLTLAATFHTPAYAADNNPGLHYYYPVPPANPPQTIKVDVCVYGGTPGGVAAAVQTRRLGKTSALAVFRRNVGGLTAAGLTAM